MNRNKAWWRRVGDETGSVSTEVVLLFPTVLLGLVWAMVSAAHYFYAGGAAVTIAQAGATAAAAEHGSTTACRSAAQHMAGRVGDAVRNVTITCTRTTTTVTVRVTGTGFSLLPGWSPQVSHTATVQVERITGP